MWNWLAKNGLDLALGGLSLFGGDKQDDQMTSFAGTSADPVDMQTEVREQIRRMGQQIASRPPLRLRSPMGSQMGVEPISIPGLGVQIGGAFHSDFGAPANQAEMDAQQQNLYDPFQSLGASVPGSPNAPKQSPSRSGSGAPTRRRNPKNG